MTPYSLHTVEERREYNRAACKKYYYKNRKYFLEKSLKYQKEHPDAWKKINNKATLKYKNKERFSGLRSFILKRDKKLCTNCGEKKKLIIHHLNGVGSGSPKPDNRPENLVTLCASCHSTLHHHLRGHKVRKVLRV